MTATSSAINIPGLVQAVYKNNASTTVTYTNNGFTKISCTTLVIDTHSAVSASAFTCPAGQGGNYIVGAMTCWNGGGVGADHALFVYLNNALYRGLGGGDYVGTFFKPSGYTLLPLVAGDIVDFRVYQSSGANRTSLADSNYTWFNVWRLT